MTAHDNRPLGSDAGPILVWVIRWSEPFRRHGWVGKYIRIAPTVDLAQTFQSREAAAAFWLTYGDGRIVDNFDELLESQEPSVYFEQITI